ncbi:MAG TPA: methyltransferase domain-containing protein [Candidatus Paceibacterota bacterium]
MIDPKQYFKKWPRVYFTIGKIFGPLYLSGLDPKTFLKRYRMDGKSINLGSGPRSYPGLINIDMESYPNVDIVSDAKHLPFKNGEISMVVCEEVFEHLDEPIVVVTELARIMAKGGFLYVSAPFLYPYHAAPDDYQRFTLSGYRQLLKGFTIVETGARAGPFSALTVWLMYFLSYLSSFGSERLYLYSLYFWMFLVWPIKYLDILGSRLPFSEHSAGNYFVVAKKN